MAHLNGTYLDGTWVWCVACQFVCTVARMLLALVFLVLSLRTGMLLLVGVQLGILQCRVGGGVCE